MAGCNTIRYVYILQLVLFNTSRLILVKLNELALAHTVTEDDEYMGYHIPAGTTIFANVWLVRPGPPLPW